MSSPSPPTPPNPQQTIEQSQAANRNTAITQYGLNATNQVTPQGTLSYQQIGTWEDGTPRFQQTTALSPEQQQLYNQQTSNQLQLGKIGGEQLNRVGGILNTPFDLNSSINTQQSDIARKLLDPVWAQRENALESKLANQGITLGSEANTNALRDFGMQRDNDYNAALLSGRQQAVQEALAQRNQPLNEISSLLGGAGVSMPQWNQTPQASVAPTNVGDITNNAFQNQSANYQTQVGQNNAMMGGLFGLAAAPLGGFAYGAGRRGSLWG
jgi:hypothetical protein